ncbi:hypothetical protein PybrP1_009085 [[Pythium] brassicae (nom. inval.)]|nr:hypothetical protein PybrP1_009085 [[Pythium] brassicae (nom. inval.)]
MLALPLLLLVVAAAITTTHAHEQLHVPSLHFSALALGADATAALQTHGVVTLAAVPGYAELRRDFLRAAAECAYHKRAGSARDGTLFRQLPDGTERFTISAIDGIDGLEVGDCPEYQQRKQLFGDVVMRAINQFSAAFDASIVATPTGGDTKLREIVSAARTMDHFHAYVPAPHVNAASYKPSSTELSAPQKQARAARESTFALNMHSDSGLFIAMSAPAFFEVVPGTNALREIANPDPDSGLLIRRKDGSIARPVQPPDELTVMIGDGFSSWVQLPVQIPAVVHGMLMPQTCRNDTRVVRAWFGKMVLLSESATMLNTGTDFAAYTRQLGSMVERGGPFPAHFAAVACPAQRRLAQNACSYRACHPFTSLATREQCAFWCNTHSMDAGRDFASDCQQNCICSHHPVTANTFACWMSCFEYDPACKGEQDCEPRTLGDANIASRVCRAPGANDSSPAVPKRLKVRVRVTASVSATALGAEQRSADTSDSSEV